jgi:hypothetical protein
MRRNRIVVNDDKTYDRNNINDLEIPIVDNNNTAQQQGIIFKIRNYKLL